MLFSPEETVELYVLVMVRVVRKKENENDSNDETFFQAACVKIQCSLSQKSTTSSGGSRISRWRGRGPRRGGAWTPETVRLENFVCQNERIWTLGGVCAGHSPSRSANDVTWTFLVVFSMQMREHTQTFEECYSAAWFWTFTIFDPLLRFTFIQQLWK